MASMTFCSSSCVTGQHHCTAVSVGRALCGPPWAHDARPADRNVLRGTAAGHTGPALQGYGVARADPTARYSPTRTWPNTRRAGPGPCPGLPGSPSGHPCLKRELVEGVDHELAQVRLVDEEGGVRERQRSMNGASRGSEVNASSRGEGRAGRQLADGRGPASLHVRRGQEIDPLRGGDERIALGRVAGDRIRPERREARLLLLRGQRNQRCSSGPGHSTCSEPTRYEPSTWKAALPLPKAVEPSVSNAFWVTS